MKKDIIYDVKDYINPDSNELFYTKSGKDLQELLWYINHTDILYRPKLGLNKNTTFGFEIESEYADFYKVKESVEDLVEDWRVHEDITLHLGVEVTSPILNDRKITWELLKKICDVLKKYSTISSHSGAHIHIGAHIMGKNIKNWLYFIKLWATYENIIYRFCYGEYINARSMMYEYAVPIANEFHMAYIEYCQMNEFDFMDLLKSVNTSKAYCINFSGVKQSNRYNEGNTIEFRCPNGTFNPIIWQNNLNLFINMLKYSISPNFDIEKIIKRSQMNGVYYNRLNFYGLLYLDQALEFCDLIFKNNLDKVYFMRQYLKNFDEVKKDSDDLIRARKFTKQK